MNYRLADIAGRVGGILNGDGDIEITGAAGIKEAGTGEITFLGNTRYEEWLDKTAASAVILPLDHPFNGCPSIHVADPYEAFREVAKIFKKQRRPMVEGIHPSAQIGEDTTIGEHVAIGPNVVVGNGTEIGDHTVILPGTVIGLDVKIGSYCLIYPNVVIWGDSQLGSRVIIHSGAVIGDDGFGFVTRKDRHEKVEQLGRVDIEDDVEIGANTTIDRAMAGATSIRKGTRIDNLVQIAHNVSVGANSIICAQVGIAGSTTVGENVTLAGQVGITGHIEIGDRVMVGAQSGVTKSIPAGERVSGYPATPHHHARRMYASFRHLPELLRDMKTLKSRVAELENKGEE
jgi:UDP-3-O-[3-hydroxymyristoyl] glucosamine N-acyltransferase